MKLKKIISGGQTGADQGALDAAIALGIPHGGWIPKGRKTEDGPLPERYLLREMSTTSYPKRTEKNILDSHGTLIFTNGQLSGGSALTKKLATQHGLPCLHIDLKTTTIPEAISFIRTWIQDNKIAVLNVAGSRESKRPGIHDTIHNILLDVIES